MHYLIYCGPGIGDFMLILPMAQRIKASDPDAYIMAIMTSDKNRFKVNKSLFAFQNYIDNIDYYSVHEKRHILKFLWGIGFKKFDYGFALQYTDNANTSEWPYRIVHFASRKTCGIKLQYKSSVHYDYDIPRTAGTRIANYPMLMLDAIGIGVGFSFEENELINKSQIKKEFKSLGIKLSKKRTISIIVGTANVGGFINGKYISNAAKNWPYESWHKLSNRFNKAGYQVFLLGGAKEKKEMEEAGFHTENTGIVDLVGQCNIAQSMAVICYSDLVIGADTGLMHCSGALNIPSLTIFGCTDYREYLPYGKESYYVASNKVCSPCFGTENALVCKKIDCMKEISVEQVYHKASIILLSQNKDK